jgi:hypothetical protein
LFIRQLLVSSFTPLISAYYHRKDIESGIYELLALTDVSEVGSLGCGKWHGSDRSCSDIDGNPDCIHEPSAGFDYLMTTDSAVPLPLQRYLIMVALMHDRELREVSPLLGATIR